MGVFDLTIRDPSHRALDNSGDCDMKRATKSILMAAGCLVLVAHAAAKAEIIGFRDDFQSDTAEPTGSANDLDPVIGAGDVGGSWVVRETTSTHTQVINDTVPGN